MVRLGTEVTALLDAALQALARPDRADSATLSQIDVTRLAPLVEALVDTLDLGPSYSLLVVSPQLHGSVARYGYRAGFSADDMERIANDPALHALIDQLNTLADKA